MAGGWIKLRTDLQSDPAVIRLASLLKLDTFGVIGRLTTVWVWADTHADRHGHVTLVSRSCLDSIALCDGFGAALESVGWLKSSPEEGGGITFPRFDRHMGEGAKQRAQAANRKQKQRSGESRSGHADVPKMSRTQRDTSVTREEKKREEKKTNKDTPLPPAEPGGGAVEPPTPDLKSETGPDPEAGSVAKFAELVGEWVAAKLPGHESANGIQRTPNRVGHWQARLRDPTWAARWREAVRRAGRSARCRGEDPKWPQGLRLDTFVSNPDVLVRVLEGEFDAAPGAAPGGGKQTIDDVINDAFRNRNSGGTS